MAEIVFLSESLFSRWTCKQLYDRTVEHSLLCFVDSYKFGSFLRRGRGIQCILNQTLISPTKNMRGNAAWSRWWIVYKCLPNPNIRMFCFPYAGASASIFQSWDQSLPEYVELCALQLPGRANRFIEPAYTEVGTLIPDLAKATLPLLDKPFVFFGHSIGAILSFEMARWLRRNVQVLPQLLFVSGPRAPQIPDCDPIYHAATDDEFIAHITELNGTPKELVPGSRNF